MSLSVKKVEADLAAINAIVQADQVAITAKIDDDRATLIAQSFLAQKLEQKSYYLS